MKPIDGVQLIVGLGNPGGDYTDTRHNAGFWFVDAVAESYGERFSAQGKFFGETARISLAGGPCWLLKPSTFMNRSGQAVSALASYYKIELQNILVAHDELDLPPGQARLKQGGGHAGHNGLRDIIKAMSGQDFLRLRLGIGHPGDKSQVVSYVLGRASKQDDQQIHEAIDLAVKQLDDLSLGRLDPVMQHLHSN